MAKREVDYDVDELTKDWIGINKFDDAEAWQAWFEWRRDQLKCNQEPIGFTVPSSFPPTTVSGCREYIAILQKVRSSIGWKSSGARLPKDVSSWMG